MSDPRTDDQTSADQTSLKHAIEVGQTYEHWWPFQRSDHGFPDQPNWVWTPGFTVEMEGDSYQQTSYFTFDGEGHQLRTVVAIIDLPKPYKPRIFFKRQWRGPDGKVCGHSKLHTCGEQAFRNWLEGKKTEFLAEDRAENADRDDYNKLPADGAGNGTASITDNNLKPGKN